MERRPPCTRKGPGAVVSREGRAAGAQPGPMDLGLRNDFPFFLCHAEVTGGGSAVICTHDRKCQKGKPAVRPGDQE